MNFWKKLRFLLRMHPLAFAAYGVMVLLWNCLIILSGLCLQWLFDIFGAQNTVSDHLYRLVILLLGIYIARGLMSIFVIGVRQWGEFSLGGRPETESGRFDF